MTRSTWIFRLAGIYGLLVLTPQYLLEHQIGLDDPPPITHPEFFYGFVGVGLAWQIAFLVISLDPVRYRAMMVPAILEKASFGLPCRVLWSSGRISSMVMTFACIDLVLGTLFAFAFCESSKRISTFSNEVK